MRHTLLATTYLAVVFVATLGASPAMSPAPAASATPSLPADTGINFTPTPAVLTSTCDAAIASAKTAIAKILSAPPSSANFATLQAIESAEADLNDATVAQQVLFQLSPDKAVRDASTQCNQKLTDYQIELGADPAVYAVAQRTAALGDAKTQADKKLVEYYVVNGKRAGAGLDAANRQKVTTLFEHLADLERDFGVQLSNDNSSLTITAADAATLSADFRSTLKRDGANYVVPVNESTVDFLMIEKNSTVRKQFLMVYGNRGGVKNVARLQEAIGVRDQIAHLLGYTTWASYQLDAKMAKTPQRVEDLLNTVSTKLLPKANQEVATLTAFKHKLGSPGPLERWDYAFYENLYVKANYNVDEQLVRQYFPVDHVVSSVLGIYQKLLGVTFAEITPPDAWAPGVREFSITDTASGKPIGWFFLDLFPRPGKYDHFANFPLRPGRVLPDGSYQKPISSIIGNWPVAAPGKPALLSHGDVIVFFHEFGHLMHSTLSTAPYETLYGTSVRPDFVEAPSQMLENFMWQPSILKEVSSNYKTGQPLPDDLINKMIALKHVDDGYAWATQAFFAQYDMTIHSSPPDINVNTTWFALEKKMTPFPGIPGTHPEAGFGHLMGGYDAGYYGYLWSKVYAQDIFTRFQKEGLENPEVGMAYRKDILEPGATVEPDVLVQNFLGRPVNPDAFYQDLGITP